MKSEFKIQMTTGAMYKFLMYHTYHKFSGFFSIVLGLVLIGFYLSPSGRSTQNSLVYLVFGILFLLYEPWTLYTKAAQQAKLNPVFKKPLTYIAAEEGIQVVQDEASSELSWDNVYKVRETAQSILVYTNTKNAFIWIKKQMGVEEATVRTLIRAHVPAAKCKLKK